ncbi:HepT-like ribonuclease domain-containing protein [Salinarimonas sp.]|uniref:HepT-like ribonuclease domain-containing protein n=1 Tax=Salinarimonas sp. TaxID=2766526 RepID=UPI0032D94328
MNALPRDLLARYPQIDWPGFVGLRNIIAHQYHRLDPTMLRRSAVTDLPQLVRVVTEMRASLRNTDPDGAS